MYLLFLGGKRVEPLGFLKSIYNLFKSAKYIKDSAE